MNSLSAESISVAYDSRKIINGLDISFEKSEVVSIIGPNGSGKSTILRALGRLLKPSYGIVLLDGKDIHRLPAREVARRLSILPQGPQTPDDITVKDLVSYGRSPYHGILSNINDDDKEIIDWAMKETHVDEFAYREVATLSGGERQRAWLAMAIAQQPKILLLDEPTTFLDIHHQFEIMELLQRLHQTLNITIIMVIHDINHAVRYSNRVVLVKNGKVVKDGHPFNVITDETIRDVFGVKIKILTLTDSHCHMNIVCVPYEIT